MTPEDFETCFVPVPLRWRHVVAGDVIVGKEGQALHVESVGTSYGAEPSVRLCGWDRPFDVDPDELVQVLTPVPMVQAVELTREQIGMRLIERRNEAAA